MLTDMKFVHGYVAGAEMHAKTTLEFSFCSEQNNLKLFLLSSQILIEHNALYTSDTNNLLHVDP